MVTLTAVLAVIGFLAASSLARSAPGSSATVSLRKTALGQVLVNSKGRTIYMFMKDKNGKSACNGACARFWPPLLSQGKPTVGAGLKASLARHDQAQQRQPASDVQQAPALHLLLDKQAGQIEGRRESFVRRQVVRRLGEGKCGRQGSRYDQYVHVDNRRRRPTPTRSRRRLLRPTPQRRGSAPSRQRTPRRRGRPRREVGPDAPARRPDRSSWLAPDATR